jgi:hypothetical protein
LVFGWQTLMKTFHIKNHFKGIKRSIQIYYKILLNKKIKIKCKVR